MAKRKTNSARKILWNRLYKGRPDRIAALRQTQEDMELGLKIRRLREDAGLTQMELASRIGTQPSAISRIEDAEYDGHSVETLRKIAHAMHMRLRIEFQPEDARCAAKMM